MIPDAPTVTPMKMGEAIPEWLVTLEPNPANPQASRRGEFRFAVDVDILDLPDYFLVLPRASTPFLRLVDADGTEGCILWAASKPVHLVTAWHTVEPHERPQVLTPFGQIAGFPGYAPPAPPAADYRFALQAPEWRDPAACAVQPVARPGFWARLRADLTALFGGDR